MNHVYWSTVATADLDYICNYMRSYSNVYAKTFVRKIFQAIEMLIKFPLSGRLVPEYELDRIREILIFTNYRLIYQVTDNTIGIIAIHHQNRNIS